MEAEFGSGVLPNKILSGRRYLMQVLVVDDHAFVREGVRVFLERHGYTVFQAADVEAALAIARDVTLDAAILDLIIPIAPGEPAPIAAENGIRLGSRLIEQLPHLGIVFLSSYMHFQADVFNLLRTWRGGVYYKSKMAPPQELIDAIQGACRGRTYIDPTVLTDPRPLLDELRTTLTDKELPLVDTARERLIDGQLSDREMTVARSVAASRSINGAARELDLSPNTVTGLMTRIYDKLGLSFVTRDREADLRADVLLTKAFLLYDLGRTRTDDEALVD